jgi:hypothetical protein
MDPQDRRDDDEKALWSRSGQIKASIKSTVEEGA